MIQREYLTRKQLFYKYKELRRNNTMFTIAKRGLNNSLLVPSEQTKYINIEACKEVINPKTQMLEFMLAGEYTKECLKEMYEPFRQNTKIAKHTLQNAPIWYSGSYLQRELVYIDIKSCYYQLYKKLWLDFTEPYMKPPKMIPLKPIAERLKDWKAARNSVMGYLASEYICNVYEKKHHYIYIAKSKKYFNPCILHCVNLMLHELATHALKLGSIYINTDGYFFLKNSRYPEMMRLLDKLGLEFRTILGLGDIYRFNAYRINGIALRDTETEKHTKFFDNLPSKYLDNIITKAQADNLATKFNFPIYKVDKQVNLGIISWWSKLD